jgi:hypothetical protein
MSEMPALTCDLPLATTASTPSIPQTTLPLLKSSKTARFFEKGADSFQFVGCRHEPNSKESAKTFPNW